MTSEGTGRATLEDALDGLQAAERYCAAVGLDDEASEIAELYQRVGAEAPEDDWDDWDDDEKPNIVVLDGQSAVKGPGLKDDE